MSDLVPGQIVGSLRLVRELGRGGMGSVWEAEHVRLKSQVAVKFLAETFVGNDGLMARFAREATAAAGIRSPHVVQIHDHGTTETGRPYIVMELLEGESLAARIIRTNGLQPDDCERMVQHVCRALDKAHAAGLVHRDVKPENIFACENDGEVIYKVLDFGVAKPREDQESMSMTSTGMAIGTPYYMSPEQIVRAKDVDHRSDVWALGIVTYESLTARRPFEADSIGGLAITIDRGAFEPPTQFRQLPEAVDLFFRKAFSRSIDDRHQTAKEFANAFAAAIRNDSRARIMSLVDDSLTADLARDNSRDSFAATARMSSEDLDRLGVNLSGVNIPGVPAARASQSTPHATSVTAPGTAKTSPPQKKPPVLLMGLAVVALAGLGAGGAYLIVGRDAPAGTPTTSSQASPPPPPASTAPAATTSVAPPATSAAAPPASTAAPPASTEKEPVAAPPAGSGKAPPKKPGKPGGGKKDDYGF